MGASFIGPTTSEVFRSNSHAAARKKLRVCRIPSRQSVYGFGNENGEGELACSGGRLLWLLFSNISWVSRLSFPL
jgi:hypothetical protein